MVLRGRSKMVELITADPAALPLTNTRILTPKSVNPRKAPEAKVSAGNDTLYEPAALVVNVTTVAADVEEMHSE